MTNYLQRMANHLRGAADAAAIPQTEPLDEWQVCNSAGGHSYPVDQWRRLERFLILGSEGGSYYATERTLTRENVDAVKECIKTDGIRTVKTIVDISDGGRAPKNGPALFTLAFCAACEDVETRQYQQACCTIGPSRYSLSRSSGSVAPPIAQAGTVGCVALVRSPFRPQ